MSEIPSVGPSGLSDRLKSLVPHLPLLLAAALLAVPTFIRLGAQTWSRESGAHGPIVLATGIWLISRKWQTLESERVAGHFALTLLATVVSMGLYIVGRAYDFISMEGLGLYGFGLACFHNRYGFAAMLRNWFPLLYLGLLMPIPGWILDSATAPLKLFVSYLSTSAAELLGLPVVRQGVTMTVGPYQLLVEDACSGLNSLIGLTAITSFYIYLLRAASWRYSLFLTMLVIPIAIIANVMRILTLILLTYYFGDAVGQGFLHVTAGLFLFAISLVLMFAIDSAVSRFLSKRGVRA